MAKPRAPHMSTFAGPTRVLGWNIMTLWERGGRPLFRCNHAHVILWRMSHSYAPVLRRFPRSRPYTVRLSALSCAVRCVVVEKILS